MARPPRDLLQHILEAPDLPRAVRSLEPLALHRLLRRVGLEDCGALVALATPEQLLRVFDEDLWHASCAGEAAELDADRFGLWLEVLVEAGPDEAAHKLASIDFDFVAATMSRLLLVVGPGQARVLEDGRAFELGAFVAVARREEGWDAIVSVLASLQDAQPAFLGRLLARLHDTDERTLDDAAAAREARCEQAGYVTPSDAAAFLALCREPVAVAVPDAEPQSRAVSEPARLSRIREELRRAREQDPAAYGRRTEELGYLANVLVAGCGFQSRRFSPAEAAEAALATCNLGLAYWPEPSHGLLVRQDLVAVFRVGWRVRHELVSLYVARRLVEALATLRAGDSDTQRELRELRARLAAQLRAGTPWRERDGLDVLAVLDPPTWAVLLGLLDECPLVPRPDDERAGPRPLQAPKRFEFISDSSQVERAAASRPRSASGSLAEDEAGAPILGGVSRPEPRRRC